MGQIMFLNYCVCSETGLPKVLGLMLHTVVPPKLLPVCEPGVTDYGLTMAN